MNPIYSSELRPSLSEESILDMGKQPQSPIAEVAIPISPATESTSLIRRRPQLIASSVNQPLPSPKKSTLENERVFGQSIFREPAYPSV